MNIWQTTRFQIHLEQPKIMGIINSTPDSFSDGGQYSGSLKNTLSHAEQLLKDGADILDIGGESTRPNANYVSPTQEWQRIQPILAEVSQWQVPISLDTRRTQIMQRALEHGYVDIINDVQGLEDKGAIDLLAQYTKTGICLMHMQGLPENMQNNPNYRNVVQEVSSYLHNRVQLCQQAGITLNRLTIDPGFGFGKNLQHNIALMQNLTVISGEQSLPILIGVSRKRMIGELTQQSEPSQRISGSIAAALYAINHGAKIIRVHDVRATADAIKVWQALNS